MSTCLVRALSLSAPPSAPLIGLLRIVHVHDATQEFPTLLTTETPHHQRTEMWRFRTGTPYHPFDAAAQLTHKSIECPQCTWSLSVGKSIFAYDVDFELTKFTTAFLDTDGVGYSQENFKTTCLCGFRITMDNLGMYKFVKNIIQQNPPASYLAYVFRPKPCHLLSLYLVLHPYYYHLDTVIQQRFATHAPQLERYPAC